MSYKREGSAPAEWDPSWVRPIEAVVEGPSREDFEFAMRKFKKIFNGERILGQLKEKSFYEKPSARKRRKSREAAARAFANDMRDQMIKSGEWDRRQRDKAKRKVAKLERQAAGVLDV
jgi:ribosomal protein S21